MRIARTGFVFLVVSMGPGGCNVLVRSMAVGEAGVPRVEPCVARWERWTAKRADERYRQVGVLCVSPQSGYSGNWRPDRIERNVTARRKVELAACALGGNVLVPLHFCGPWSSVEYSVYREAGAPLPETSR